ncbi:hypothetical protein [Nitrosomonas sp. Is37]|uniref:hypothetical protein n=1 Tax=Nitrosomonas sp. Is37 TaxID=3080535 RepID=UPI00294ACFD1|nr:hypothetical protein [Nitrosomonas sp. Is37]MDV6344790.1 hypothetical protein [Nitrosomonas sp. Is37]
MNKRNLLVASVILLLALSGCGDATKEGLQMREQQGDNKKSTNLSDLPPSRTWNVGDVLDNDETKK